MTKEQIAFIEAYRDCVGDAPESYVREFLSRYEDEDIEQSTHYTSVMDALCLWERAKTHFSIWNRVKTYFKGA
jgi:hypothetical protein